MRVISGLQRGRILLSPGVSNTRPTSEKVKEAIFSSLQGDLPGAVVLDLFSGSGQLGIEALSRGADFTYFVECDRQNFDIVKKNVTACGFAEKSKLFCLDARLFLKRNDIKFDIAFLDPPYGLGLLNEVLPLLYPLMNPDGIAVCEHGGELFKGEGVQLGGNVSFDKNATERIDKSLQFDGDVNFDRDEQVSVDKSKFFDDENIQSIENNVIKPHINKTFSVYRQKKYGKVNVTMLIKN